MTITLLLPLTIAVPLPPPPDIFDNNPLSYLDKHPIKNTKLYWLLSRCLEEDPNKRSIIFI